MLRGKMYYFYQKMIIFWLQNITVMVQNSKCWFVRAVEDATWNRESETDDYELYLRELLYSLHKWIIILIWISKMTIISSMKPPTTAIQGFWYVIYMCHTLFNVTKHCLYAEKLLKTTYLLKKYKNECPSRTYMILLCSF